jgi:hypothetical protein
LEPEVAHNIVEPQVILRRSIADTFHTAGPVLIEAAAGGYVVAVIDKDLATAAPSGAGLAPLFKRLAEENGKIANPDLRIVLWEIDFYPDEESVYAVPALLRTNPMVRTDGTSALIQASSLDASVAVHALEAEALLIDPRSRSQCRVRPSPEQAPLIRIARYLELDLKGQHFAVSEVSADNGHWLVRLE